MEFVVQQQQWMESEIATNPGVPIWTALNLVLTQLEGMSQGYMAYRDPVHEPPLGLVDFLYANFATDDSAEVMGMLYLSQQTSCWQQSKSQAEWADIKGSHCSAFVKPVGNPPTELLVAHNSWFDYRVMLRIMKSYHFSLLDTPAVGDYQVLFSSYPGLPWSMDDFYMIRSGSAADPSRLLYVMETTNTVCNASLYALVQPKSLFTWQRTLISNMLAQDGKSWTDIFAQYNSGTYNNQMQIVDYKRFDPGNPLPDGLFWIIEQMPGATVAADVTSVLESQGYWGSYNRPYFEEVYEGLGYAKTAEVYGDYWTHDHCPRANIFRRDNVNVDDMESLKALMRSNNWQTDPLSMGDPFYAIAARGDLVPGGSGTDWVNKSAVGCVDAKITSYEWITEINMRSQAISGPTTDDGNPPFLWDSNPIWSNHSHIGQPNRWNFGWNTYIFTP